MTRRVITGQISTDGRRLTLSGRGRISGLRALLERGLPLRCVPRQALGVGEEAATALTRSTSSPGRPPGRATPRTRANTPLIGPIFRMAQRGLSWILPVKVFASPLSLVAWMS
jgi:hypothetical protein